MMKYLLASSLLFASPMDKKGIKMKLIHDSTGFVVVEFIEGKARFQDRFLAQEMKEEGIFIPKMQRVDFEEKELIYPDDPLFEKAFVEIYYPLHLKEGSYHWE